MGEGGGVGGVVGGVLGCGAGGGSAHNFLFCSSVQIPTLHLVVLHLY